jgi:hypothetical protein
MPTNIANGTSDQHDHHEHGEVRVVLRVDKPIAEVREVHIEERKEVPPRVQKYQMDIGILHAHIDKLCIAKLSVF